MKVPLIAVATLCAFSMTGCSWFGIHTDESGSGATPAAVPIAPPAEPAPAPKPAVKKKKELPPVDPANEK